MKDTIVKRESVFFVHGMKSFQIADEFAALGIEFLCR